MARFTYNYRPKVGDLVRGMSGKRLVIGRILEHPKHPGKPFVFCSRGGVVLCYIETLTGGTKAVNEIRPVREKVNV